MLFEISSSRFALAVEVGVALSLAVSVNVRSLINLAAGVETEHWRWHWLADSLAVRSRLAVRLPPNRQATRLVLLPLSLSLASATFPRGRFLFPAWIEILT